MSEFSSMATFECTLYGAFFENDDCGGYAKFADQPIVDGQGNIYVLSVFNDGVFKYTPDGRFIIRFGAGDDEAESFDNADAFALDRLGNVYIAESDRVYVFGPDGMLRGRMVGGYPRAKLSAANV
ncbi:MAG: hypothetical protein M1434_06585 [Chloroflexi bacterium]|nr:hypothetical protein [Chloroflexota bacterium]MCL5274398.1 hypothetical protein [Chloroflexota bacterium]